MPPRASARHRVNEPPSQALCACAHLFGCTGAPKIPPLAIVIFSDFEDGIIQWRTIGETKPNIVFDADLRPPTDLRTEAEKSWDQRWIRGFAQAQDRKAPRLYLYSTSKEPQEIYRRCVAASGGDFKIVTMQRAGIFGAPVQPNK